MSNVKTPLSGAKTTEYLDVVNDNDKVVSNAAYEDIYKKLLTHRIVNILIFNKNKELLLQLRAKDRSFCPLHWSTSVGGHVRSGETPRQAALRECQEELGVKVRFTPAFKDVYLDKQYNIGLKKFLITFKANFAGSFKHGPEVAKIKFFNLNQIQQMINSKEKMHPELLFLLERHFGIK
jgi:isopentenyldiphosphate isomerase